MDGHTSRMLQRRSLRWQPGCRILRRPHIVARAGATLLLCLGTTVALLVVGRLLEGVSGAVVWSVGLALMVDMVGKDVGQSMGY